MMKKYCMIFILIIVMLFNGCFSYTDINKALFVTAVIVDVDAENNVVLYLESFLPYRSSSNQSAKGERIIFKGSGKSVYEVMKDINLSSSYKLDYTQNRAIIFTKKAAEYGIDNFIDPFERQQELLIRPYVLVYIGDTDKLIKLQLKEEEYIGVFINNLINNQQTSSRTVQVHLNNFMIDRVIGSKVNVVTTIDIPKDQPEDKIQADGGTIIKNDKFAGVLEKQDGEKYNFLINNVKEGTLEPENPDASDKFVTLDISNSHTKITLTYDGKTIHLNEDINTKATIADVQKKLTVNKSSISKLEKNAEGNIKKMCTDLFEKYKKENIDIFNIQEEFNRKYPEENIKDAIKITDINIRVKVNIADTLDRFDFN